jgi:integrase
MQTSLTPASASSTALAHLDAQVRAHLAASRAPNTRKAEACDLRSYAAFCESHQLCETEPTTLARYLALLDTSGAAPATIRRRASTIRRALPQTVHPAVKEQIAGLSRLAARGGRPQKLAPALMPEALALMLEALPLTLAGLRDRALLLLGWAGALREEELVRLCWENLATQPDGLLVTLPFSKTDQTGQTRAVCVHYQQGACPVAAVRAWQRAAGLSSGPVLRSVSRHGAVGACLSVSAVDAIVQRAADAAGLPTRYTGHSLRAGWITTAFQQGASEPDIMRHTGHKSVLSLRRYRRDADAWQSSVAAPLERLGKIARPA